MAGKLQSLAFIVIILWCSSWLNIQHATARPLNTLVLHADADEELRRSIVELSHTVLRSLNVGDGEKNMVRKLVMDNSGPSPDGPGHKEALPSHSKPNN
ncbi:hypothetical protein VNO80_16947 [Phaseolus coccineus]|uniref:Uncharacterized protein n=1 Tax=Phaseolus coccineus TaxID=3886 RepID=A0AAN9MT30_PHACN